MDDYNLNNPFVVSKLTYCVTTEDEDNPDWMSSTVIETHDSAIAFMDWIAHVHECAEGTNLLSLKEMGIDLFCHKTLYILYRNRKTFDPFNGKLAAYEGKLRLIPSLSGRTRFNPLEINKEID